MNRRHRKRLLIFLLVPLLAAILFITDDLIIRVITIILMIIYVAFIIFLRDSIRFDGKYSINEDEELDDQFSSPPSSEMDESFKIISKTKNTDIITAENYQPELKISKTTLKPPDLKERFEEIANESLPPELGNNGQFGFVLEKMLTVIKEAYGAHSAIFFWYNKKKEKLTIEKYISSSDQITKSKLDIEDDILSKIVQRSEPELLTEISPAAEADVIRYYDSPQGIRSFVGAPIYYDNQLIAILSIDSKVGDQFGIETIYSIGRFVRVITMIIQIFEEKHSDSISQSRLKGLLNLIDSEKSFESQENVLKNLTDSVNDLIEWDAFTFVYFKPVEQKFETTKVINKTSLKYIGQGLEVELNGTLTGKAVISGIPVKIDDTGADKYVRFSKVEDLSFDGSFLGIPLFYANQIYGILCFESLKKNAYTNADVKFLKNAVNIISFVIYSHSTHTVLKGLLAVDMETRALNAEAFKERLSSDLIKMHSLNASGALALIKIDDFLEQESLFEGDPLPKVIKVVAETISKEMTAMNIFGRMDEKTFIVNFFNTVPKNVFIWAEKLRVKIARKPIAIVSQQTTYTVSIGVATTTGKLDADEVIYNAELALQKALEKGGNSVRNIS
ncbi:MAG TPA: GAF domain-containing protein [Ignavibacteriaceae bacterium]|nr:GAF domain-containing protein [Ignavibacteriaceae bacterium]